MRKIVKKIATVVAAATMIAAMNVSAFAEIEGEDYFMITGDCHLFGVDEDENSDFWNTIEEDQELPLVDTVETTNTVYAKSFECAKAGDWEFKILKDGADFGWSFQCCLGNPDAAWADNQTQFRATMEAGTYTVYVQPMTGYVVLIQNQKVVPMVVRFHSRDEDSQNFVDPTSAAIKADGYADTMLDDAKYQEFKNACVVAEGGTPEVVEETTAAAEDETTIEAAEGEDTTAAAETKAADKEDDEDDNTILYVGIGVAVVAVIAIIAVVLKKKN